MTQMDEREWTLMFYFASDTPLAPEIVSQLKSIKQAGFHDDVNVIVQFDPNPVNVQTHIFDVNRINKVQAEGEIKGRGKSKSKIGFIGASPHDPYIVNLMTDKVWGLHQKDVSGKPVRDMVVTSIRDKGLVFDPPTPKRLPESKNGNKTSGELSPRLSLDSFLTFCSDNYPARHYMLFILGHGLVVGNDTFLFDENAPERSLKLQPLREVLKGFKGRIEKRGEVETGAQFELISFHSCSMSSLEIAYELQGIANYMLASQSPSFVGSWPYRQILIRLFNYQEAKRLGTPEVDVKGLLKNIFHYCLYNSADFLAAGYSSDACLCDLNRVQDIQGPLSELSASLIDGLRLNDPTAQESVRERILLAHMDAQSYFNENYTDLFDFCFRLQQRCKSAQQETLPAELQAITDACQKVMEALKKGVEKDDDRLIVRSDFVGPAFQYSHGLSVYFPWSQPLNSEFWPSEYNEYQFSKAYANTGNSWSDFLAAYFSSTMRRTRIEEFAKTQAVGYENETRPLGLQEILLEALSAGVFNTGGQLEKPGPDSSQGDGCTCQSIKNYPSFTREPQRDEGTNGNGHQPVQSPTLLRDPSYEPSEGPTFVLDGLIE